MSDPVISDICQNDHETACRDKVRDSRIVLIRNRTLNRREDSATRYAHDLVAQY